MITINISLPTDMYKDAKRVVLSRRYSSISELFRFALRGILYPEITENGFTKKFEDEVLASSAEPRKKNLVWESEADITSYFKKLDKKAKALRNGKN